jgi:hypothetical protein
MPYNTLIHTKEMTKAELFNHITHIIASPHTAITEHDKRRAVQVFLDLMSTWLMLMLPQDDVMLVMSMTFVLMLLKSLMNWRANESHSHSQT